jgi:hypothetical protein
MISYDVVGVKKFQMELCGSHSAIITIFMTLSGSKDQTNEFCFPVGQFRDVYNVTFITKRSPPTNYLLIVTYLDF